MHRCVSPGLEDFPDVISVNEVQYTFDVLLGGASIAWLRCPNGVYATPLHHFREKTAQARRHAPI